MALQSGADQYFGALGHAALQLLADRGLLNSYVRETVSQEALAQEVLSQEDCQRMALAFAKERGFSHAADLEQWRQQQLISRPALTALMEKPLRLQRHLTRLYRPKAEARFLERKSQLDRVVYSIIRHSDHGIARELYLRLEAGEADFSDLAARYSLGPESGTRGVVGPIPLDQSHPLLVQRLRTAKVGVVQEPFPIERWWIVFRLESHLPAIFDDLMAEQMARELFDEWLDEEVSTQLRVISTQLFSECLST